MSGITTGVGVFSGIDSASLIQQLLVAESRPRTLAQQRLIQLQTQQAAFLDLNSRLSALRTAAASFRTENIFDTKSATSSLPDVLTATAGTSAAAGSFTFVVDRLVTTRQLLSRGFTDRDTSGLGLDELRFEDNRARLTRDTALSEFNDGQGIDRGKIKITDSNGNTAEVDLSRVGNVSEVLDAINSAAGVDVTARVEGGRFVLLNTQSVSEVGGGTTAESLGLSGALQLDADGDSSFDDISGRVVYGLNRNTALSALNDGRGITFNPTTGEGIADFVVNIDGVDVDIRLGEIREFVDGDDEDDDTEFEVTQTAAATVGQAIDRINAALADAGYDDIVASIDADEGRIVLTDSGAPGRTITVTDENNATAAAALGISGSGTDGLTGQRVLAGLNTVLTSSLNGGSGIGGDGSITFDTSDGGGFTITGLDQATTLDQLIRLINEDENNAGAITASLNEAGNGLRITDNTSGSEDLVISGTGGDDTAESLGIAGTFENGTARGNDLDLQYIGRGTLLSTLNNGAGVSTGRFRITDGFGNTATVSITQDTRTIDDVIRAINSAAGSGVKVRASINDTGDGIVIREQTGDGSEGTVAIKIENVDGSAATDLGIEGTATGVGADNLVDGSFEKIVDLDVTDTLADVVSKINDAGVGVDAAIINDGGSTAPYRLSLTSENAGAAGRFVLDSLGVNLGLATLDEGEDSRIFFGSSNPANGVLLTGSSNTLDSVVAGVTIDLRTTSEEAVTLTIAQDADAVESKINEFVEAFNSVLTRIDQQTRFVEETGERGPLLGDGTALNLRQSLITTLRGRNTGFSTQYDTLAQVGISVGNGGKLTFDRERFRDAYANNPEAVESLFTTRKIDPQGNVLDENDGLPPGVTATDPSARTTFTELGVIAQIEEFAVDYIDSISGVLTERDRSLTRQITLQQDRIAQFDERLLTRRGILERQFAAMEQAIAQLQTQGSALAVLG